MFQEQHSGVETLLHGYLCAFINITASFNISSSSTYHHLAFEYEDVQTANE